MIAARRIGRTAGWVCLAWLAMAPAASAQVLVPGDVPEAGSRDPMLLDTTETARTLAMGLGARASALWLKVLMAAVLLVVAALMFLRGGAA